MGSLDDGLSADRDLGPPLKKALFLTFVRLLERATRRAPTDRQPRVALTGRASTGSRQIRAGSARVPLCGRRAAVVGVPAAVPIADPLRDVVAPRLEEALTTGDDPQQVPLAEG